MLLLNIKGQTLIKKKKFLLLLRRHSEIITGDGVGSWWFWGRCTQIWLKPGEKRFVKKKKKRYPLVPFEGNYYVLNIVKYPHK